MSGLLSRRAQHAAPLRFKSGAGMSTTRQINILRHSRRFFICAYKALLPAAP
ncbi:flagellar biosynthesis protein FlgF [Serratia sp. 3ACOL1]|nr:flagellar biosynthesis protein FlgF [Serratia sp. 3ACOL1]